MFQEHKSGDFEFLYNLRGVTTKDYAKAFELNEKKRIHVRKNNVIVFHEVLSFSHLDSEKITNATLKEMLKKYIQLRNPHALYVAVAHYDRSSIHIHIMMSGVASTGLSSRVSRQQFNEVKQELQSYQVKRFPELMHSIVKHGKGINNIIEKEFQLVKRTKQPSNREEVKSIVLECYSKATSREDFYSRIENTGLQIYKRKDKNEGIVGKLKMRFSSIGINESKLEQLDKIAEFDQMRTSQKENFRHRAR
jgi:hypothetical protein